ncbi:MAG: acetyltransferase [Kiritimatiellae bacterium]|nr:acetyltransferase [Kiritimatiellia bacterium]
MRDLFIVGAGGFGREAICTVERINAAFQIPAWRIIGYADDNPKWVKGGNYEGYPILGTVEEASKDHPGASVFVAIGNNRKRADIYRRLRGHDFPAIIDPSAQVSPTTELEHGVYIASGAVVQVGATLGMFTLVGAKSIVGHDASVGEFVNLGPGSAIAARVKVGDRVSFFANASTMPAVEIGEDCIISCGTGIKTSIPPGTEL